MNFDDKVINKTVCNTRSLFRNRENQVEIIR